MTVRATLFHLIVGAACATGIPALGHAQSMVPMSKDIKAFSDVFAVRVTPINTYTKPINVVVRVYDLDNRVIKARVTPRNLRLPAKGSRRVLVEVPFEGAKRKRVRICTESIPFPQNRGTQIRTRICGVFNAQRL